MFIEFLTIQKMEDREFQTTEIIPQTSKEDYASLNKTVEEIIDIV
jgi:hypothetical protein